MADGNQLCPACGRKCPSTFDWCDCGYDFIARKRAAGGVSMAGAFITGGFVAGVIGMTLGAMLTYQGPGGRLNLDLCSLAIWVAIGGIIGMIIRGATRGSDRDAEIDKLRREVDNLRRRQGAKDR